MPVCWMNEWMQVFREYHTHNIYTDTCYAMLSHFSRVWLCVTPETADHQAPPSLGFSRQEHWSGLPFSFCNAWKWKVKVKSLIRVRFLETPWTAAHQAPLSMGFSRQEYWSGVPLPSPYRYIKASIFLPCLWFSLFADKVFTSWIWFWTTELHFPWKHDQKIACIC